MRTLRILIKPTNLIRGIMTGIFLNAPNILRNLAVTITILFLLSCSMLKVQWVSDYDPVTDSLVTEMQKKTDIFFIKLQEAKKETCFYESNSSFYLDMRELLAQLSFRVNLIPENKQTIEAFDKLNNNFNEFENNLHKQYYSRSKGACMSPDLVKDNLTAFNIQFRAILKLEIAKKRGKS